MIIFSLLSAIGYLAAPSVAMAQGMPFALCNGSSDEPNAWICNLENGVQTGEENSVRCQNSTLSFCQVGAGGDVNVPGFHNIPAAAWFAQASVKPGLGMIKCQCGCFTGDMNVLTTQGWISFNDASKVASKKPFRLGIPGANGELLASDFVVNTDFTVGPEDKQIIRLATADGLAVHLTENHPVLVFRDEERVMVQARSVKVGESILRQDGTPAEIVEISRFSLSENDKNVFNVDTKATTSEGHVILVNGLQMGDAKWQQRLSERESRQEELRKASL